MGSEEKVWFDCEYIVVGSGAGGGTVAARLAEAGHSVILLEAGGDPRSLSGGDPLAPDENRLPADYDVPCFHPFASENSALKWAFFVVGGQTITPIKISEANKNGTAPHRLKDAPGGQAYLAGRQDSRPHRPDHPDQLSAHPEGVSPRLPDAALEPRGAAVPQRAEF